MEMIGRMLLCMVLLLPCFYMTVGLQHEAYSKEEFPDPRTNFTKCGQEKASYICDPSQNLTKQQVKKLNGLIERQKGNHRGPPNGEACTLPSQILVAIVPRIKDGGGRFPNTNNTQQQFTRDFAEYLGDKGWNASRSAHYAVHVVIVVDLNTVTIWTATSLLTRKVITDDRAKKTALDAGAKYIRTGNVFGGLQEMLTQYRTFMHQGLPLLDPYIRWLFTGITILILVALYSISYSWSKPCDGVEGAGSDDSIFDVWRVSGVELVVVVAGMAVVEVFGVTGMGMVGAVVGAAVTKDFREVRTVVEVVVRTTVVMVVGSAVGTAVAVPVGMTWTVWWVEVFGAALVVVVGKLMVLGVAAGMGMFGAAVLELFKARGAAVMVVVWVTAVVAGLGAACTMEVVVHAAEWMLPGQFVGVAVWTFSMSGVYSGMWAVLLVVILVMGVIIMVTNVLVPTLCILGYCGTWVIFIMLPAVLIAVLMLIVTSVQVFGVVVTIVLAMVLGMVAAASGHVPKKLSKVEVLKEVLPTKIIVAPVEAVVEPEVGAVRAVVKSVKSVAPVLVFGACMGVVGIILPGGDLIIS